MTKRRVAESISPIDLEPEIRILKKDNVVRLADNLRLPIKQKGAKNPASIGYGQIGFCPTDDQRKLVYMLRAHGMPNNKITMYINNEFTGMPIDSKTLAKHFWYELEMALEETNVCVSMKVLESALGVDAVYDHKGRVIQPSRPPNPHSQIWWEKTRAGMKETSVSEHGASHGTKVTLIIEG